MALETPAEAIRVEITDASAFHCFRLTLTSRSSPGQQIEIMLHARSLVDLIHRCSSALCDWQLQTTSELIQRATGFSEAEAREHGLIA